MGVSGSGKTTVGVALARQAGGVFIDGDDFHPPGNIGKMRAGGALTDEEREPWLERLREEVVLPAVSGDEVVVLACSALKTSYRDFLGSDLIGLVWVFLRGDRATLESRLRGRVRHFFSPGLLESQLEALEEPEGALSVEITRPVDDIVAYLTSLLKL